MVKMNIFKANHSIARPMKTSKQIHPMVSRDHASIVMYKCSIVLTIIFVGLLVGCRPSSTTYPSTLSSKTGQENVFEQEDEIDQRAGYQVIQALSKAYGTDSTVTGDFLDSPYCPSFLEGMYFDGSTLVFQVRGDTVSARKTLESAADSDAFRLEAATSQSFTQKQLKEIMDIIRTRHSKLTDLSLKNNMVSWGMGSHHISVTFILNTPEARKAFREKIVDSPSVLFEGPTEPSRNERVGVSDTLGIRLQSDYPVYSTQATQATFTLVNLSNTVLECGEFYSITYEDEHGVWRDLPIHTNFFDLAHLIRSGEKKDLSGALYPEIHANKPGRYRFFYEVTLSDTGKTITLMAEFRLTDSEQELLKGCQQKATHMPLTQDSRPLLPSGVPEPPTEDNRLYQVVDKMPEFPGGMKRCMEYIQAEMCYPQAAKTAGVQGRVVVQFIIEKDGTLTQTKVVRHIHPELDAEALRIVRSMPKWKPGRQDGTLKRVLYTLPISFRILQ